MGEKEGERGLLVREVGGKEMVGEGKEMETFWGFFFFLRPLKRGKKKKRDQEGQSELTTAKRLELHTKKNLAVQAVCSKREKTVTPHFSFTILAC